ncbi:Pao retrotransposon peptidase [Popillia japonica]|uniref:Pao retrotransposon peptidase n=1 Tax=Popillia japonica TaxID=7064 RepID=A0AAW1KPS0_POPJA
MYRQVWIDEEQRKYQKILWRENPDDELKSYTLNTVTFGMAAAPFLAIRSLVEIAKINEDTYPNESQIIKHDFYVDDLLTGSSTIDDLATIKALKDIEIPRLVLTTASQEIQMHGFCDASEKAYGACVYLRSKCEQNKYSINLLASKSRVAPLKVVTLPRLELLGAVLLTQVMANLQQQLRLHISSTYYWTDSQIVLSWIKATPAKWKTFVANRVALIQESTNISDWYHVKSKDN